MKKNYKSLLCGLVLAGAMVAGGSVQAAQNATQHEPDNTAVNKRDRNADAPTADNAKNNYSDRDLMEHIRRDVVHDKSISKYGHNVKVVADHGKVTLKGPVHSEDEKRAIEEHARKYAGDGNIDNQLEVKGETK